MGNVGKYWGEKVSFSEEQIINWIEYISSINKYISIYSQKEFNNVNSLLCSNKKLDVKSRKIFTFYFRKIFLKENKCKFCGKEIEKDFIINFKRSSLSDLPNWCEEHYKEKKWMYIQGNKYSDEANEKRSTKMINFFTTDKGLEYRKVLSVNSRVSTILWKSKLTIEEKHKMYKK